MSAQPTIKKTTLKPILIDVQKSKFKDLFRKAAGYRSSQRAKCRALGLLHAKQKARFGLNEAADDGTPRRVRNPLELSNGEIADFFEVLNASPAETHLLLLHEALLDLEPLKPRPAQLLLQLTNPVNQGTPEGSQDTDDNDNVPDDNDNEVVAALLADKANLKLLLEEERANVAAMHRVAATLRQERDRTADALRDLQARYDLKLHVQLSPQVREICKNSINLVVDALAEKFEFDAEEANNYLNEPIDLTQSDDAEDDVNQAVEACVAGVMV